MNKPDKAIKGKKTVLLFLALACTLILISLFVSSADGRVEYVPAERPLLVPTNAPTETPPWQEGYAVGKGVSMPMDKVDDYETELDELGVDLVRVDLSWELTEPYANGVYYWDQTPFEDDLQAILDIGAEPLVLINSPPEGYQDDVPTQGSCKMIKAEHVDEFQWFLYWTMSRYDDDVDYWEIFNEPDFHTGTMGPVGGWGCYGDDEHLYIDIYNAAWYITNNWLTNNYAIIGSISFESDCDRFDPTDDCGSADFLEHVIDDAWGWDGFGYHFYNLTNGVEGAGGWSELTMKTMDDFFEYIENVGPSTKLRFFTETSERCQNTPAICNASYFEDEQATYPDILWDYKQDYPDAFDAFFWYSMKSGWEYVDLLDSSSNEKPVYDEFGDVPSHWR